MKKELRPFHDHVTCDVCGRTILKGERTEAYLAPGGERHRVCELCFVRAEHAGWIRESAHGEAAGSRAASPGAPAAVRSPAAGRRPSRSNGAAGDRGVRARPIPSRRRRGERRASARAPARAAAGPAPRARGAHHRRGQGRARARAVQLVRAPAHRGGPRPQPRVAVGHRSARPGRSQHGHGGGRLGALLVSLPGGPRRRRRARGAAGEGRRARTRSTRRCASGTRRSTPTGDW